MAPARDLTGTCVVGRGGRVAFDALGCTEERSMSADCGGGTTLSTAPGLILAWLRGDGSVETVGRSVGRLADDVGATPPARRRRLAPFPRAGAPLRRANGDEEGAMLDGRGWTRTEDFASRVA